MEHMHYIPTKRKYYDKLIEHVKNYVYLDVKFNCTEY